MFILQDLYAIFQEEPTAQGKVDLLRFWSNQGLGFNIDWANLINFWNRR